MLAEVEVVWGKCVRTRVMEQYKRARNDLEALNLYNDVTLFLEWGNLSTANNTPKRVFVMHPQVFLTPSAGKYAKMLARSATIRSGKLSKIEHDRRLISTESTEFKEILRE
jgi:hypothetical protein